MSETINRKESYTSANAIPMKVFKDKELMDSIQNHGIVLPRHVQLNPTNRCNLDCSWCSCSERELSEELKPSELEEIIQICSDLKTKGVTITGGGDPTLHPYLTELVTGFNSKGIKTGLVTNGIMLPPYSKGKITRGMKPEAMEKMTWIRVSYSDFRKWDQKFVDAMDYMSSFQNIDKAFSYVLTKPINFSNLENSIKYANEHNFTHVRIVPDLYDLENSESNMEAARNFIKEKGINDDIVIYQQRKYFTAGAKDCQISLLKPYISADGMIYPCCGVQYAMKEEFRGFPKLMQMGHYKDLPALVKGQKIFDGENCVKCYYEEYNHALSSLKSKLEHPEFL
jgi:organic radical activating enzyme